MPKTSHYKIWGFSEVAMNAQISEVFQSMQGEGPYQGVQQLFIRFFGCDLSCKFCDTHFVHCRQWSLEELLLHMKRFRGYHSISLTGGEPLLQTAFLQEFLPRLKRNKKVIYLETNGIRYEQARSLIQYLDIVAMDFKLSSSTSMPDFWAEHRKFLNVVRQKQVFIKAVVTPTTRIDDVRIALGIIREVRPQTLLVLQPAYPYEEQLQEKLRYFAAVCDRHCVDVRIMQQLHKELGVQ